MHVLGTARMARQTSAVDLRCGMILEDENLRYVSASCHVVRTWAMATLASLVGRPPFRIKRCLPVRGFLPTVVNILMAGFADFCSNIAG